MTTERTFTPITPEGLRGLGFELKTKREYELLLSESHDGCVTRVIQLELYRRGKNARAGMWFEQGYGGHDKDEVHLGTAPDLETVADLIDVLRRMNGGG